MLFRNFHHDTVELMAGPLRLATKYQVEDLRNRIIAQFKHDWSDDLDIWDTRFEVMAEYGIVDVIAETVLRLAYECDIPDILPTIFYALLYHSRWSSKIIGVDNTSCLTQADLERVCTGRGTITSRICAHQRKGCEDFSCPSGKCKGDVRVFWGMFSSELFDSHDPLRVIGDLVLVEQPNDSPLYKAGLCPACRNKLKRSLSVFRQQVERTDIFELNDEST